MGLGHGGNNGFTRYPLIVDSLTTQGLSTTRLFSLDLGRQNSPGAAITGELVFGGVDTNRYAGMLQKVPTDPSDPHYRVTLNSLAHRPPGATVATPFIDANLPVSVIIDSGTTLSLLPESVVSKVAAQFPGAQSDGAGGYRVDCAYQSRDGSVEFSFLAGTGTVTINVSYNDFIWNSGGDCFLGVWTSTDLGVWILGDTFLRGAYVTFDQTNNALFMSNYVSCGDGSNLISVPAGPDAAANIPGACVVAATSPLAASLPPTSSPTFPAGTPASTAVPSAGSSLGPSLNPVEPPSLSASPTPSTSTPPSRMSSIAPALVGSPQLTPGAGDPAPNNVDLTAGADPKATPAMKRPDGTGAPVTTITATVTRGVVYTVTACPDSVTNCPIRGHVATRFETVVTTFCPGHDEMPGATTDAGGVVFVTEPSVPTNTFVAEVGDTVSSGVEEEEGGEWVEEEQGEQWVGEEQGEQRVGEEQGIQWVEGEQGGQQLDEEQQQQQEAQVVTTVYPATKIYKIASCAATDAACATGMTTTRVVTISKTVVVHPVPTLPAPAPAPENAFAPAWKGGHNASATRNGTQWQGPAAISAAAVDDAKIDKRYLGAVFVVVWGVMVLL
ncbi:aspartic peptidase domain-containing protein [Xylaria grammica]|nr:aspartic peptidase domain-containing protein [Xylaria grammica]